MDNSIKKAKSSEIIVTELNKIIVKVSGTKTFCNGGYSDSIPHPKVFLSLAGKKEVLCPYCEVVFKAQ